MIRRIFSFIILAWMLGFVWFALLLPQPAAVAQTDAVVVLTGGPNRIDRGLEILKAGKSRKMLISGVDRDVKPAELAAQYPGSDALFHLLHRSGFPVCRHALQCPGDSALGDAQQSQNPATCHA